MADEKKATAYVVLRQTADGRWAEYAKVDAAGAMAAIKQAAVKPMDTASEQGRAYRDVYIAVPARSFQPVTAAVKREPSVVLKAVT